MKKTIIDTRIKNAVLGHTDGGELQDYARAKQLIEDNKEILGAETFTRMTDLINSRKLKKDELKNRQERQDIKLLEEQFGQERFELDDLIQEVDEDPNADISDQLNRLQMEGKIDIIGEPHMVTRERTGIVQKQTSTAIRMSLLDKLSETDDPNEVREELMVATLSGQLASQDASAVLNSVKIRKDSKYASSQLRRAKQLIKKSQKRAQSGPRRDAQNELFNEMITEMETLMSQKGIAPQRAAKIVLKDRGLLNIDDVGRVKGLISNQDTLEGLEDAKNELFLNISNMSDRELFDNLEIIENRQNALELIPTIDETKKGGR